MKNDLTQEQLRQAITVTLPLGVVLGFFAPVAHATIEGLARAQANPPSIGEKGIYGICAGVARGYNGERNGVVEVLDEAPKAMTWDEAMKWAESIDGRLPTRKEQALLFANVPELFKQEAYWSCAQHADDSDWAWYQHFSHGSQYYNGKRLKFRARAVRRVPL